MAWVNPVRVRLRFTYSATPLQRALASDKFARALGGEFVLSDTGNEWVEIYQLPAQWDLEWRSRRNFVRLCIDSTPWGVVDNLHVDLEAGFERWIDAHIFPWIDSTYRALFPSDPDEMDDIPF